MVYDPLVIQTDYTIIIATQGFYIYTRALPPSCIHVLTQPLRMVQPIFVILWAEMLIPVCSVSQCVYNNSFAIMRNLVAEIWKHGKGEGHMKVPLSSPAVLSFCQQLDSA